MPKSKPKPAAAVAAGKPKPPALIAYQGETIKISLKNELPVVVSAVFPGQQGVQSACISVTQCADGLLT